MGSNREWDGTFVTIHFEKGVPTAIDGKEIGKGDDGGLIKTNSDGSWEMFGPSDGPKGHYHGGKDSDGNVYGHG